MFQLQFKYFHVQNNVKKNGLWFRKIHFAFSTFFLTFYTIDKGNFRAAISCV
jgi:hypothetical protein